MAAKRAALFVASLLVFLGIAELFLRHILPDRYYVWPPGFQRIFEPDPAVVHGVRSPSRLTINAAGMRGDLPGDAARYRILAVGGSTTICVYLDDSQAWPYLLQRRLNAVLGEDGVWVGNVGRPAHTTQQHVLQVEKLLEQHPEIDALVLMIGINDMLIDLSLMSHPSTELLRDLGQADPNAQLRRAFSIFPGFWDDAPWYARNVVGRLWWVARWHPVPQSGDVPAMDRRGEFVHRLRGFRARASSLRGELPELGSRLDAYVGRVEQIAERADAAGVRLLLSTQPTLWRERLSGVEQALLWGGGPPLDRLRDGAVYYSVEALAEAMRMYNDALLGLCRARGIECVDLAEGIPRDAIHFYDDAHFSEAGSARVAELLADYLLAREPLRPDAGAAP